MSISLSDVEGSVRRLKERINSKSFTRAVGKGTVNDIEILIRYYESTKPCVKVSQCEVRSMYNMYVAAEGNIRRLLEGFLETMVTIRSREFAALYPFMPSDVKDLLKPLLSSNVDEGIREVLRNLLSNLNQLGSVLLSIAKREPGDLSGCEGNRNSAGGC
ncbi:hypothetical protein [Caldivirga sp. MU80]|uniref:hypothetical protein n=1 Tax=Caldivirga sp. MU80 TaxID=1650354 RepID=UPI00082F611F|nr:hypothetical protein [Caldivirga sp. MU80]